MIKNFLYLYICIISRRCPHQGQLSLNGKMTDQLERIWPTRGNMRTFSCRDWKNHEQPGLSRRYPDESSKETLSITKSTAEPQHQNLLIHGHSAEICIISKWWCRQMISPKCCALTLKWEYLYFVNSYLTEKCFEIDKCGPVFTVVRINWMGQVARMTDTRKLYLEKFNRITMKERNY
jgi:hypothetical protein